MVQVSSLLGDEVLWGGTVNYSPRLFNITTMGELVARQRLGEEVE